MKAYWACACIFVTLLIIWSIQNAIDKRTAKKLQVIDSDESIVVKDNVISIPVTVRKFDVSAYCPCEKCCERFADGITASGKPAKGFLVAAPPEYPFGTLMKIPGYNNDLPVPVLDRGSAIKGNKLDILMKSHDEALRWGRQFLTVTIIGDK